MVEGLECPGLVSEQLVGSLIVRSVKNYIMVIFGAKIQNEIFDLPRKDLPTTIPFNFGKK